jgi:hypothetical protein
MKSDGEIMEILEAFDLTNSYRDAAELAGCSHHTVEDCVAKRDAGLLDNKPAQRDMLIDPHLPKLEEWVEASKGKIRADVVHEKLTTLGYGGSERTTRRAVAIAKKNWRQGNRRIYRPWVPEPGMWFQWDYGWGPMVAGRQVLLFCAWLAWSRYRVVLPILDKSLPSVIACIDTTLRRFGGCPTYGLTDNEKTVTVDHVAGIPVRNPDMVAASRHYGLQVVTCMVADPETKGGSEATVRLAKADIVPTDANLLDEYSSFADVEAACLAWSNEVNNRVHRVTRRIPAEMLAEEQQRLHKLPAHPYTVAFGQTRVVGSTTPMVAFENASYSVPSKLAGETVWVRDHGDELVFVHVESDGPKEIARHQRTIPGSPRVNDDHFPPSPPGPLERKPSAKNAGESAFLAIGPAAVTWLERAAEAGTSRMRIKMASAVDLAALHGIDVVNDALAVAADAGRFDEGNLSSIIEHRNIATITELHQHSETKSLAQGTSAWEKAGER